MNTAQTVFLELLASAMWNRAPKEELFHNIGTPVWEEIHRLSLAQKVNALVYDGVMLLPPTLRPEKKVLYKLHLEAEAIEKSNERINNVLKSLSHDYESIGCPFVLLKGQGNATLYPNPLHRTPGDIDAYLYQKGDYDKANTWARSQGYEMEAENIHHQAFYYKNVLIENHHEISYFGIVKYDRLLEKKTRQITANNHFLSIDIDGLTVRVLPHGFNAFFIFQHLFHHFIHLGIGIRQLCDWVLYWNAHSAQIDGERFKGLAKEFGLLNAMQAFASVAVKYLGASPNIFPFPTDTEGKYVDLVMEDIFAGGSFGYAVFKDKRFNSKLHRKWHSFSCTVYRMRKINGMAPRHIATLPLNKVLTNIKLLFKK